jgi:Glyoxalase/Bleomycin resistance protein/Dioxygenase superfamily
MVFCVQRGGRIVEAMVRHPIFQYAYFVDDLVGAAENWARTFDAGPFFVASHHRADTFQFRGTSVEADVSYAFGYAGDCQIQLIEQHDDLPSIYRDMYGAGQYGFHHVAVLVRDYPAERRRLLDQGNELACELHANDIDACYFDTRTTTGCFTELHSHTDRIVATFDRWKQAHLHWDGTGDALRTHTSGT